MSKRAIQDEGCNDPRKKPARQWSLSTGSSRRLYARGTRVCATAPEPTTYEGSEPELVRGIAKGFRSRLSVAGPEGTLVFTCMRSRKQFSAQPTHPWRYVHRDEREDQFTPNSPTSSTRTTRMSKRAISGRGMQRSSRRSQQGNGHGARDQVAVSKAKEPGSSHDFWA